MVLLSCLIILFGFEIFGIHLVYALLIAKDVSTNDIDFEISDVDNSADTFLASSFPYDSISATSGADRIFTQEKVSTSSDAQNLDLSSQGIASGSLTTEYIKPDLIITSKQCSVLSGRSQWVKRARKGVCECMSPSELCPDDHGTPVCCYVNNLKPDPILRVIDACVQCKLSAFRIIFCKLADLIIDRHSGQL